MFNGLTSSEMDFVRIAEQRRIKILRNGWPDFMLVRGGLVVAVEVKHGFSQLSPAQREMREVFAQMGIPYFVSREGRWPPELVLMIESPLPTLGLTNRHLMVLREASAFCNTEEASEFKTTDLIDGLELSQKIIFKVCELLVGMGYLTKRKGDGRGSPNLYRFVTTSAARRALSILLAMF